MLHFVAHGVPQPKGSARAFTYHRKAEKGGGIGARVDSANPKNKNWQQLVAVAAMIAIREQRGGFTLIETAAVLRVAFYLPRPKSLRTRIVSHTTKPDLDKLVRSVKDALSAVVYRDDALIVAVHARKYYAAPRESPRAEITVTEYTDVMP